MAMAVETINTLRLGHPGERWRYGFCGFIRDAPVWNHPKLEPEPQTHARNGSSLRRIYGVCRACEFECQC